MKHKRQEKPFCARRENRRLTEGIGERCEIYTAYTLHGQLLFSEPDKNDKE